MQFHKEVSNFFQSTTFNKNKRTIYIGLLLIVYVIMVGYLISQYTKTQKTISIVAAKGTIYKNQPFTENNIQEYKITEKDYIASFITNPQTGQKLNTVILWSNRNFLSDKYSGMTKGNNDIIKINQLITDKLDYSNLVRYDNPGKIITPLDISNSDYNVLKNMIEVGDKINIWCSYETTYNTNVSIQGTNKDKVTKFESNNIVVLPLFTGVQVADILNSKGNSLLDYKHYIESSLTERERIALLDSEEYEKYTKVSAVILALTEQEVKDYIEYINKRNIKFYINLPEGE